MLAALLAGVAPHPPRIVAPFAMAPFLGASMSIAAAALVLGPHAGAAGIGATMLAAATALLSYGPQKWFDPAIGEIWPAVLVGQVAALICVGSATARLLRTDERA